MKRLIILGSVLLLSTAAAPARAQRIEITPFVGYQFGGELAEVGDETTTLDLDQSTTWGLIFDVSLTHQDLVEVYYSSQSTNLDGGTTGTPSIGIEYIQIGAIHEYAPNRPLNPYVGFTLGATRFEVPGGNDTQFSGGLSIGAKMTVSDHLGFRFDGRVLGSSTGSNPIGCVDDVCLGYPDSSIFWQYTVNAGVIVRFDL
jgi:opacity protein-like surface antigen